MRQQRWTRNSRKCRERRNANLDHLRQTHTEYTEAESERLDLFDADSTKRAQ